MRLVHLVRAASSIAIAALFALSSCVLPLATSDQNCTSYCTLLQGCGVAGAPEGDCGAWCTAYAETLDHVGCKAAFDDAAQCVVGDGTCQAESCSTQTGDFLACTEQFCATNPTDAACPSS